MPTRDPATAWPSPRIWAAATRPTCGLHAFAEAYAGLSERDHQALVETVRADRLSASEPYGDRR
ncbi:hypothetical protein OG612_06645 [Streptomyces sp. NBC_01527]|uniref:hypothetical protein n=1 Tax=Streptomyces sp. NBC_01527 TaxID=2903894 RepID=UPI003868D3C1